MFTIGRREVRVTVEQLTVDHYFAYFSFGPSGVRALPLADCTNEGGHYFRYIFPLGVLTTVIQNHRRGCRRVSKFCMGT